MEKYKLLSLGDKGVMNTGDYIQALASSQFYPHVDGFVYREKLKDYNGEPCNMIINRLVKLNSVKRGRQEENIFKEYVIDHIISEYPEFLSVDLVETLTTKFK